MASYSNARCQALLLDIKTDLDGGSAGDGRAYIRVYNGTVPLNLDTALSGNTLLAELPMADPSFADPTDQNPGARIVAGTITDEAAAIADGTPTFARLFDSDGVAHLQVTAGIGSGELNFTAAIVSGLPVEITSFIVNQPEV